MKKKLIFLATIIALSCAVFSVSSFAKITGNEPVKAEQPLLITNAGQGPGGKMARLLVMRSQAVEEWDYNAEPEPEDIDGKGYKTMLVVIGSSSKGLGASGITIDDEINRLNLMIEKAKELDIQIIAAQIEGKARRDREGGPNERSINAIAPHADYLIVKEDADFDGKFTKIAEENEIPMTIIEDSVELTEVIKAMYSDLETNICE